MSEILTRLRTVTGAQLDPGHLPGWREASSGAAVYYNVHRWMAYSTGTYTRMDPHPLGRALDVYGYAAQRPTALVDPLGLQATSPLPTGDPLNDRCCGAAHSQNLFAKAGGAAGIVVCCNGNKVACVLQHDATQAPPSARLAYQLSLDCVFEHEQRHIPDLPDCPSCDVGPQPVDLQPFPTPAARRQAECPAADVEITCLERSKRQCAGDPKCIQWLERFKGGPRGLKRDSGCSTP